MKKSHFLLIAICILICCLFSGCNKVTNKEEKIVQAQITSTFYKEGYINMEYSYSVMEGEYIYKPVYHDPEYSVTVTYQGVSYTFPYETYYQICNGYIGQNVNANYLIREYEDGTVKAKITGIVGLAQ